MRGLIGLVLLAQLADGAGAAENATTWMSVVHDDAGNTTLRQTENGTFTHLYDGFDRQREVIAPDGKREVYWYAADGSRAVAATMSASGDVERVRWTFGGTELWYGPNHAVTKSIAHVANTVRIENRTNVEHVFADQYGHTLADIGDNGAMLAGFVYGPFGETLRAAGPETSEVTRRFNGKEHDDASGLSYYGARYYDPLSLTWTQADPMYRFAPDIAWDEPRRMSAYAFSLNNSLRYVDPNGLDTEERKMDMGPRIYTENAVAAKPQRPEKKAPNSKDDEKTHEHPGARRKMKFYVLSGPGLMDLPTERERFESEISQLFFHYVAHERLTGYVDAELVFIDHAGSAEIDQALGGHDSLGGVLNFHSLKGHPDTLVAEDGDYTVDDVKAVGPNLKLIVMASCQVGKHAQEWADRTGAVVTGLKTDDTLGSIMMEGIHLLGFKRAFAPGEE